VPGNIAQANNHGLEQARGDLVAVLDDDDYWRVPEKLAEQVRFLDAHPDHVACGGGAVCIDLAGRETMRYLKPLEDAQIRKVALLANPMVHSTTLYRRAAARDCGFYDETLAGFQDWDLFLKLGQRGRLANLAEYLLCYQIWEGSGSFSASKANTRSAIRIVKRHRAAYRGYPLAILSAYLYHFYSHWPTPLRRVTYSALSRAKKALFSRPAGRGQGSASG
jgi:glycosyltransferase involved in cell wall biosynthesis